MIDKKEYSNEVHSQVIGWTENCDTKASIALAFIGVIIPLLLSNDYVVNSIEKLLIAFVTYWKNGNGRFSLMATLMFLSLISFISTSLICSLSLISCLKARLKCNYPSVIFFYAISKLKNDEYKKLVSQQTEESYLEDKLNQIHTCSRVCSLKFDRYKRAITYLRICILSLLCFLVSTLLFNVL